MNQAVFADLERRAQAPGARIERVELSGKIYWIKRPEVLSLRMRLQKGNAANAFAAEVAAHRDYASRGLPVAPVVMASDTYLVTEDCGPPIRDLARRNSPNLLPALAEAARALASLHDAGVSHGRPSLKDICRPEDGIAFLDLERANRAGSGGRSMDVLILIFSTAVETGGDMAAMTAARDAYVAARGPTTWQAAQSRARRYAPLRWLLWPVARVLRGNREFDAIGPFFLFMRG